MFNDLNRWFEKYNKIMKVLVQRMMDYGYGITHLKEDVTFDKTLYENIQKAESDSEIYDARN